MTDVSDLWESATNGLLEMGLSEKQTKRVPKLREWLRATGLPFAEKFADLSVGSAPITCNRREMGKLEKLILDQCTSLSAAQLDSQIVGKLAAYLNRVPGFKIVQPGLHNQIALPHNPFTGGVVGPLQLVKAWLAVEAAWNRQSPAAAPSVELVVLSAILHGGLLHTSSVLSFARALLTIPDKGTVGSVADRVYIDLTLPWRGQPDMESRTWQPDDQTAALSIRFSAAHMRAVESGTSWNGDDLGALDDQHLAVELLRRIAHNIPGDLRPTSLKHLVDTVALCAQSSGIPAVIVEYASREIVSHSLKSEVLRRIYNQPKLKADHELQSLNDESVDLLQNPDNDELSALFQDSEDVNIPPLLQNSDDREPPVVVQIPSPLDQFGVPLTPDAIEPPGLSALRAALRTKSDGEALRRLDEVLKSNSDKSSIWYLITEFAKYLLKGRHVAESKKRFDKNFKLNSAKLYAITVGRRLGRTLGDQNILELSAHPQSVETLFTEILENAVEGRDPRRTKRRVAQVLREFHRFLFKVHHVPEINYGEVLGVGGGLLPVDSNIVTSEEFLEARRIIRYESAMDVDEVHALIAEVVLILGFRCGTRRMEALGLEISDLIDRGPAWLFIRPSEERGLKTPNSTRQLPLTALVPREELDLLLEWKKVYCDPKHKLASGPGLFDISEGGVMATIHTAMRKACGDDDVHFHNLRHSFATWTFLRLMLSDLGEIPNLFPHLPKTTEWLRGSKTFRTDLYGYGDHTRKHALAIASLLGHSGAKVSTEHYIHCLDWLQPLFFGQCDLLRVKNQAGTPVKLFRKKFSALAKSFKCGKIEGVRPRDDPGAWSATAWKLLAVYGRPKWSSVTLKDIAENLGFNLATAELMVSRAEEIQTIEGEVGKKAKRHVMEYSLFGGMDLACPKKPSDDELLAVQSIGLKLAGLAEDEREETRRILGYYVHHIWKTENALMFNDPSQPEDAKRYRKFLAALGWTEKEQISFVSFDNPNYSPSRRAWGPVFGINWRDIKKDAFDIRDPPFKKSAASDRWIGLEPKFVDSSGNKLAGSQGFRFLMVMAAIVFGYQSDEGLSLKD